MSRLPSPSDFAGPAPTADLVLSGAGAMPCVSRVRPETAESVEDFTRGLVEARGYRIARLRGGGWAILFEDGLEETRVAGAWADGALDVLPAHRGMGLGKALVLAMALDDPHLCLPPGTEWTRAGHACALSAHRLLGEWLDIHPSSAKEEVAPAGGPGMMGA